MRERPFWGYRDLFAFIGLMVLSLLAAEFIVRPTSKDVIKLVAAQFAGYGVGFGLLAVLLRAEYDQPFWRSMAWLPSSFSPAKCAGLGLALAIGVNVLGTALQTPTSNPMMDLLSTRTAVLVIGVFGITLGPLAEELMFRGMLQPLLVGSLGVLPGIFLAAVPFGLLHLPEYGYSWRHGVLITLAGMAFGWMRHVSGSTRAATYMHAAYNSTFFAGLILQGKGLPDKW